MLSKETCQGTIKRRHPSKRNEYFVAKQESFSRIERVISPGLVYQPSLTIRTDWEDSLDSVLVFAGARPAAATDEEKPCCGWQID